MCINTSDTGRLSSCPYECIFTLYLYLNYIWKHTGRILQRSCCASYYRYCDLVKIGVLKENCILYYSFQKGRCERLLREIKLSALSFRENFNMGYQIQFCNGQPHLFYSKWRTYVSHRSTVKIAWTWIWLRVLTLPYLWNKHLTPPFFLASSFIHYKIGMLTQRA